MKSLFEPLRTFALALSDTTEGVACAGTALESRTAQVRGKAFLFLGSGVIRLRLGPSLAEATACAGKEPTRYQVGSAGWTKIIVADGKLPPIARLRRWIQESHALLGSAKATPRPAVAKARTARRRRS